jgi:hypothetical protein
MSSLKFIMDVDEEVETSRVNKRDKDASSSSSSHHHDPTSLTTNSSYATQGDQLATSAAQGKRRGSSKPASKSSAAGSSSTSSSSRPATERRRSNASTDSMDQQSPYAHGHAGPSSSSGGLAPSNQPMRPFASMQSGGELPVKLTPITGRVSRAKKGVPVHTCESCRPAKVSFRRRLPATLRVSTDASEDLYPSRASEVSSRARCYTSSELDRVGTY